MSDLPASEQLRRNVDAMLRAGQIDRQLLALHLRIHKTAVGKWLSGHRELRMRHLDALAEFFGVAVGQLFEPGFGLIGPHHRDRDTWIPLHAKSITPHPTLVAHSIEEEALTQASKAFAEKLYALISHPQQRRESEAPASAFPEPSARRRSDRHAPPKTPTRKAR
jgi:Helix-turn-helix